MKLIAEPVLIKEKQSYTFSISKGGWYVISISARVKSKKQKGNNATDDDDLYIKIDDKEFPKFGTSSHLINSEASFNGAKLKNNLKTISFLIQLEVKEHTIELIPDEEAFIEKIEIQKFSAFPYIRLDLNTKAEKGDRRPWLTFVLVDVGLRGLKIKATTKYKFPDGDDIKVIIDGNIEKNPNSRLHRHWLFAGTLFAKLSKQEAKEIEIKKSISLNDFHYIELWADETPYIEYIEFDLGAYFETDDALVKDPYPHAPKALRQYNSGDPLNPAIYALRGDEGSQESEWTPQGLRYIRYGDEVEIKNPRDSIYWGVRWLYRNAQITHEVSKGIYEGEWLSWKDAVREYNGKGDPQYVDKVYSVYEKGIDIVDNIQLWRYIVSGLVAATFIISVFSGIFDKNEYYKGNNMQATVSSAVEQDMYISPETVVNSLILEMLDNATYTIVTSWGDTKNIVLREGEYNYRQGNMKPILSYRSREGYGPSHVSMKMKELGDINEDGRLDAISVLSINYGGTGRWENIILLTQDETRVFKQIDSIFLEDREFINTLYIKDNFIIANLYTHKSGDGLCCPSLPVTKKWKLVNNKLTEI